MMQAPDPKAFPGIAARVAQGFRAARPLLLRARRLVSGLEEGGCVRQQQTLAEKVSCTGTGLHGGVPVHITLSPARAGSGIVFVRCDRGRAIEIPAQAARVTSTRLATTLGSGDAGLRTVEHLLAALYGLGIDNVRVHVDGPELPVMDGSAASFVYLIRSAGIFVQREPRAVLRVLEPLEIDEGIRRIRIEPGRGLRISYAVDFAHPAIRRQQLEIDALDPRRFESEIAPARTFGFLRDVHPMWSAGLAKGGSLQNTVLLDDERVLNAEGLRWPDEFVRHKVLDLLGDLALLGVPIEGHIQVECGGHALHHRLVTTLLERPRLWSLKVPGRRRAPDLSPALAPA
jgi:UDP-3-O-[3-hydroxymyristoyl] N-acetylglucosamine deacetylase